MSQISPAEIGHLIDTQSRALCLYAAQWCDSPDDVVQESVIALAALTQRPDDPVSWLYSVVRNRARMAHRGARRRMSRERQIAESSPVWFEPSPEDGLDAKAAQSALSELETETREIIVAHIWGELTFEQIAAVVGASSSTVHRRFAAGLKTLRGKLTKTWNQTLHGTKN